MCRVSEYCRVLQCVAACCIVLQCAAVGGERALVETEILYTYMYVYDVRVLQ